MNTKEIEQIIKIFEASHIKHLELEIDNMKIKLEKDELLLERIPSTSNKEEDSIPNNTSNFKEVASPIVGVYYEAPSTGEKPFVSIGSRVKKGDKLCIIEAMKVMNEITAPTDGVITEIYVHNKDMVEYGSRLFRIEE